MKSVPIGLVMLTDERPHVHKETEELNRKVLQRWAEIIRERAKCVDGSSYEVVVGSEIVHDVRSAQRVGEELSRRNVKVLILCFNVWNYPFLVWPLINSLGRDGIPILSLSNNEGKFPGNVGLLATDGALRQAGIRTHRIIGDIDDEATISKVIDWVRAAEAYATIQDEVYGCYGGHSMGMETGFCHLTPTLKSLRLTVRQVDQLLLVERMKEVPEGEVEAGLRWFEELLGDRIKYDGRMLTPETLKCQIRLYLAVRSLNEEKGFDFCGIKGQRELSEHVCIPDVAEMLLNDPYDWHGPKEPTVCATEADFYAAVTMQLMKYVSGGLPTIFMDVRLYHPDLDVWDFCNSGNHPSYFARRSFDPKENFERVTFHPALEFYFKAGGASVEFDAAPGPMTFARLGLWDEKPYMVIVRGEVLDLPEDVRRRINEETNPTWPHVHARLECSFDEFIAVFPCNHILGVEGDRVRPLTWLCEMAGITPVVWGKAAEERVVPIWERVR